MVGMRDPGAAICGECVGLCWEILTESAEAVEPTPFYGETLSFDDDRFRVQLAAVLVSLAAQRERRLAKQAEPPTLSDAPRCSFCDLHRDAVAKLINGPRVHICEVCVATAAQTLGDELRRRGTAI
jgi:ATP-dependent protease Clp ATPase subunit